MLTIASHLKIYVYTRPADMRKGINGLCGLVREAFDADPTDGNLFVFVNRKRNRLKMLYFESGGFWLYYRVLEAGTFEPLAAGPDDSAIELDATQLSMLLSGVSLVGSTVRRKRYSLPTSDTSACEMVPA